MVGCASDNNGGEQYRYTPPVAKATNNTQEMAIPVDLVWARAEKWFGDHGLNIENSQRGAGLMTANVENSADGLEWLDCGTMGSKVALGNPNLQINLIITQSGNNSVATVNVKGNTQLYFVESSGERVLAPPSPRCASPAAAWNRACSPPSATDLAGYHENPVACNGVFYAALRPSGREG
jgi:hypothetical protein